MFFERQIYSSLKDQVENKKVTILIGPRQVGKTMLMKQLNLDLQEKYKCMYLDLDIYSQYEKVSSYENLINTITLNGYKKDSNRKFILFLDEFQKYRNVSNIIKNVVDHHPNIKIFASGSSSLEINDNIQESLAGRKRVVHIYPLSFEEFLHFKQKDDLIEQLHKVADIASDSLPSLMPELFQQLEEFLIFGGYPEVTLSPQNEKKEVLESIFDLYVKKDLVDFLNINKIKNAKTLINHLALNHGQEINYNRLGQIASLDSKTSKNYLEILRETFLITILSPWYTNKNKELTKTPKIYFIDNGVRNYFINNFNETKLRNDTPFLFESFVISELLKKGFSFRNIKFWRSKNRQEVDLILDKGTIVKPVEIKYKNNIKKSDFSGLTNFLNHYPENKHGYLINPQSNKQVLENITMLSPFELDVLCV